MWSFYEAEMKDSLKVMNPSSRQQRRNARLIGIKDDGNLVVGDGDGGRVDLVEAVVQIRGLAVHLAHLAFAPTHVHHVGAQRLHPVGVLTVK